MLRSKLMNSLCIAVLLLLICGAALGQTTSPVKWNGNGHWYQVVPISGTMCWEAARDAAINMGGHLATINSKDENDFILTLNPPGVHVAWIGGSDVEQEGVWKWVTGEVFYENGVCKSYCNWGTGEPNNPTIEKYLELWVPANANAGKWNNGTQCDGNNASFIVEYNTDPNLPPGNNAFCEDFDDGKWQERWTISSGSQLQVESPTHLNSKYALRLYGNGANCGGGIYRTNLLAGFGEYSAWFRQENSEAEPRLYVMVDPGNTAVDPVYRQCYMVSFSASNATHQFGLRIFRGDPNNQGVMLKQVPSLFPMNEWVRGFIRVEPSGNIVAGYDWSGGHYETECVDNNPNPITRQGLFLVWTCAPSSSPSNIYDDVCFDPDVQCDIIGPRIVEIKNFRFYDDKTTIYADFKVSDIGTGSSPIREIEYFLDHDPGQGNGVSKSYPDNVNPELQRIIYLENVDATTSNIYIRAKDAAGNWGNPYAIPIMSYNYTAFEPSDNGFHFTNESWRINGKDLKLGGWCLGMSRAAMVYFENHIYPIPDNTENWPPASSLTYIDIVMDQIGGTVMCLSRYYQLVHAPLDIAREYREIKEKLLKREVALIGLADRDNSEEAQHVVLGIGFAELGGANGKALIAVYDPNHPDVVSSLRIDMQNWVLEETSTGSYENLGLLPTSLQLPMAPLIFLSKCPVNLQVEDPLNRIINQYSSDIPGASYYSEFDELLDDTLRSVALQEVLPGVYNVTILPTPEATISSVFSLYANLNGIVIPLAIDAPALSDAPRNFLFNTESRGWLKGSVYSGDRRCSGVIMDIYDLFGNYIQSASTDEGGDYYIDNVPNGTYTITVNCPIGFQPDQDVKEFTINHVPVTVDFTLSPLASTGKIKNIWWWKSQLSYLRDGRPAEITKTKVNTYGNTIFSHYYNRRFGNAIQIEGVTFVAGETPRALNFNDIVGIFLGPYDGSNKACAKNALLTNLLNIAAGRQLQTDIVTEDGATASQAVTYFADLILTGDNKDWYNAHINLRRMHMAEKIPAGVVPLSTPNIMFKETGEEEMLPTEFALGQNYPNPFNPITEISFSLPKACDVTLEIFNISGQKVATLVDGRMEAGNHTIQWDSRENSGVSVASGIYLYRLKAGEFTDTKKMIILK